MDNVQSAPDFAGAEAEYDKYNARCPVDWFSHDGVRSLKPGFFDCVLKHMPSTQHPQTTKMVKSLLANAHNDVDGSVKMRDIACAALDVPTNQVENNLFENFMKAALACSKEVKELQRRRFN